MFAILYKFLSNSWSILLDAGFWVVVSIIVGGFLHTCVSQDSFKKWFGTTKIRSIGLATAIGMVLPVCSCGVVPLGLSLYWSGASLAATLAFMVATPLINPAAALMAFGLLGPELTAIYIAAGCIIPLFLAYSSLLLLPTLQYAPGFTAASKVKTLTPLMPVNKGAGNNTCANKPLAMPLFSLKSVKTALHWGFFDLGLSVSKYIIYGILFAAFIFTIIPAWVVPKYLGEPSVLSYGGSVLLGCIMYVCSVGHIPVVAALIAMGASPGVAITFLLSGVATNLPELIAISRLMKPRVACLYCLGLVVASVIAGIVANAIVLPDFTPIYSVSEENTVLSLASSLDVKPPQLLSQLCAIIILMLGGFSILTSWKSTIIHWSSYIRGHYAK